MDGTTAAFDEIEFEAGELSLSFLFVSIIASPFKVSVSSKPRFIKILPSKNALRNDKIDHVISL